MILGVWKIRADCDHRSGTIPLPQFEQEGPAIDRFRRPSLSIIVHEVIGPELRAPNQSFALRSYTVSHRAGDNRTRSLQIIENLPCRLMVLVCAVSVCFPNKSRLDDALVFK
jgi:hypothetical protein